MPHLYQIRWFTMFIGHNSKNRKSQVNTLGLVCVVFQLTDLLCNLLCSFTQFPQSTVTSRQSNTTYRQLNQPTDS